MRDLLNETYHDYEVETKVGGLGILGTMLIIVFAVGIAILSLYITGWATVYLAHMLFGTTYYTSIWTRILIGLAIWLSIGGLNTNKVITQTNKKLSENI